MISLKFEIYIYFFSHFLIHCYLYIFQVHNDDLWYLQFIYISSECFKKLVWFQELFGTWTKASTTNTFFLGFFVCWSFFFLIILLSNVYLLIITIFTKGLKTIAHSFGVVLSVAEFGTALFLITFDLSSDGVHRSHRPPVSCSISYFAAEALKNLSIFCRTWIAFERLESVRHPLKHKKPKSNSSAVVIASCLFGVLAAAPYAVAFKERKTEEFDTDDGTIQELCVNIYLGSLLWRVHCFLLMILRNFISTFTILSVYIYILIRLTYNRFHWKKNINIRKKIKKVRVL